jgi:glycosyltransferase involved in cell wall biosynthesis
MKVVHVITRLILGGAQENTILTCEGLRQRGHDVTLVTGPALGPEGELMSRARRGGYRLIVVDDMRRAIHPLRDWRTARQLRRILTELQPDIVHTHSSKAGIIGRDVAWKLRMHPSPSTGEGGVRVRATDAQPRAAVPHVLPKIVHTIHGLPFHRYGNPLANALYVMLERRAARQSDAIISVADAMTNQALARGVGRPEQYTTIYSGMEVEDFLRAPEGVAEFRASLGLMAGDVLVTQVSRLAELKGHEYILAAAERIPGPRVHFAFVGDGRRRGWIESEIARRGLTSRVHLTGLLPPDRIPLVMHATDILVHCSLREGLARTLPQAMLSGVPVVSFDVDGAREVVSAETGMLLEPHDVGGLTTAIGTLAASADLRKKLGTRGRQVVEVRFDWRTMVDRIEGVYRKLME